MSGYAFTPRARADLFAIWEHIAADKPTAADKVITAIESACERLGEFPMIGHTRADVPDNRYRFWSVYSYIIAYRPDTNPVQIIRVVSGYRDFESIFG